MVAGAVVALLQQTLLVVQVPLELILRQLLVEQRVLVAVAVVLVVQALELQELVLYMVVVLVVLPVQQLLQRLAVTELLYLLTIQRQLQ
jgi:hypothetical protein